jgi:carbonic anhydrase
MHRLQLRFDGDAGSLVINGTEYLLHQLHWHSPSEHVNGRRYDMEMHLVHRRADGKAAVIAVLYQVGRPDGLLRKLEPSLELIANQSDVREQTVGIVDPKAAHGWARVYYRYMGSLTTPPCTEGVVWTILKRVRSLTSFCVLIRIIFIICYIIGPGFDLQVRTVSKHQLELLREAVHDVSLAPHPCFPHTRSPLPSVRLIDDGRENLPDTPVPEHGEICSHLRYAYALLTISCVLCCRT